MCKIRKTVQNCRIRESPHGRRTLAGAMAGGLTSRARLSACRWYDSGTGQSRTGLGRGPLPSMRDRLKRIRTPESSLVVPLPGRPLGMHFVFACNYILSVLLVNGLTALTLLNLLRFNLVAWGYRANNKLSHHTEYLIASLSITPIFTP